MARNEITVGIRVHGVDLVGQEDFRFLHTAVLGSDLIYSGGVIRRDIAVFENFRR